MVRSFIEVVRQQILLLPIYIIDLVAYRSMNERFYPSLVKEGEG